MSSAKADGEFTKQPYESFKIAGDFKNELASNELIVLASSSVAAEDKDGNDVTATVLTAPLILDGTQLIIRVNDGLETESPYRITFYAETDDSNKKEIDIIMIVEEF